MTAQGLDEVFGALADPTRRAILARLASGDANVGELTAPFRMSQPAISRHLKVLERAGLISRRRRATARLSHLEAEPLREAAAWLVGYREYWEESYQRLDALLSTLDRREASASTSRSRPGTSAKPKRKGVPDGQDESHR
jgi:DNA-binding transcriptional ArsR family regulator